MSTQTEAVDAFISRWSGARGSELANYQLFLGELIELLGLPRPDPASDDTRDNAYVFERRVQFSHGDGSSSLGRIDLYRRGHFICEAKKVKAGEHTKGFDLALMRARTQAENYARALPVTEGRPPLLLVVDVGNTIDVYAEFSRSGATYTPFPDPSSHRIRLQDLHRPEITERLRNAWLDPLSLDPSRTAARVTREIASDLAELAKSLESTGLDAETVAGFLTRCLFTLFAEDVELLPAESFKELLAECEKHPAQFVPLLTELWKAMDVGGFSVALRADLLRFNGKLFKSPLVLSLNRDQIGLLSRAARHDWKHVEPAIFGTLLERALDPRERHSLGAHYTPRAYVERLVLPTVVEPLRDDWKTIQAAALTLAAEGDSKGAIATVRGFHHQLCSVRVLDPACGSGNFLYVTLEHLKRLEGEVLNRLTELGDSQGLLDLSGVTVDPHQFLGIELNPRAAAIAEMVLWIGHLQWHFRTRGHVMPPQPVLKDFHNIECRDAVLAHDGEEFVFDDGGMPITRWDGRTTKTSPVTGEQIPDDTARTPLYRYKNPRKAEWPVADFVVGNPPFIGGWLARQTLGDGYVETLWRTYSHIPPKADFVMYWWDRAAQLLSNGQLRSFGLITTNSIGQVFQRRVISKYLEDAKQPISITFAIPDHPWVDVSDGAAVRIAMTAVVQGNQIGRLALVQCESPTDDEVVVELRERTGRINANITLGADLSGATTLLANSGLSSPGVQLYGSGFVVTRAEAERLAGTVTADRAKRVIRPYVNGRDVMQQSRDVFVIDFFGLEHDEARILHPAAFQHVIDHVKPERDLNRRSAIRDRWWRFGWERPVLRRATSGLSRTIVTVETAKHRVFTLLREEVLPDNMLICIAIDDGFYLGVLSSKIHVLWAIAAGGRLGVGNDPRYNKTRCFDPFPFPSGGSADLRARIRTLAELIDAHRKQQKSLHADLTLTSTYNVLEKLKSGEELTTKDKLIHEHGLVSVLKQMHDELDLAVLDSYNWSDLVSLMQCANGNVAPSKGSSREDAIRELDGNLLERLVALNLERTTEEARGLIRWLRPEFQNPSANAAPDQSEIDTGDNDSDAPVAAVAATTTKTPWPKDLTDQVRAVADLLSSAMLPFTEGELADRFTGRGRWRERLPRILEMLVALGIAKQMNGGFVRS